MRINVSVLSKKAVNAALKQNWPEAIEINQEILDKNTDDKDAKIRLGRAYMHTNKYAAAKKLFKEVLNVDPINSVAKKNYELASKNIKVNGNHINPKSLLKEPGKCIQVTLPLECKSKLEFAPGEDLPMKVGSATTSIWKEKSKLITIGNDIARKLYKAKQSGNNCETCFVKFNDESKEITVIIKCTQPIFKGEKQHEKPYVRIAGMDPKED
ncbi:tetratricopeptide repeat protein [Patescibacteria group bacterium]